MSFSFGQPATATNPTATSGFSFGTAPTATPQGSTSLFGASTANTSTFNNAQNTTSSLFGAKPSAPTNMFGSTTTAAPPATSGFQFGASAAPAGQPTSFAPTGSLFGSSQPAQPTATGGFSIGTGSTFDKPAAPSLVGNMNAAPVGASMFSTSLTNQSNLNAGNAFNASTTATGLKQQGGPEFQKNTKYNDLPPEVQKKFDEFNKMVQEQSHLAEQLDVAYASFVVQKVAKDVEGLVYKMNSVKNLLERNTQIVNQLKNNAAKEMDHEEMAQLLFTSMMKHGGPGSVGVAERPFYHSQDYIWRYFCDLYASLESRLSKYRSLLDDLERQLAGSTAPNASSEETLSPQIVVDILKNNHDTFVALAAKVASLHDQLEGQKDLFVQWLQKVQAEDKNPFDQHEASRPLISDSGHPSSTSLPQPSAYSDMAKRITISSSTPQQQQANAGGLTSSLFPSSMNSTALQQQQQQKPPTLFGSTSSAAPATTSLFGGQNTTATLGGGLFGSTAQPAASTSTQPAGTGLFGTTAQTKPQTGGGLFGSAPAVGSTTTSFGFGQSTAAPTATPSFGFGQSATPSATAAPQQAQPTGSFGFGSQPNATQPTASFGFGAQPASAQPTSTFSFGQNSGLFGNKK